MASDNLVNISSGNDLVPNSSKPLHSVELWTNSSGAISYHFGGDAHKIYNRNVFKNYIFKNTVIIFRE